jgi:hypothetical protein
MVEGTMRSMMLVGVLWLAGCGGADAQANGDPPAPPDAGQCPESFHACSLGVTGYTCEDASWYYCAADGVACKTPAPCVPLKPAYETPCGSGPEATACAWCLAHPPLGDEDAPICQTVDGVDGGSCCSIAHAGSCTASFFGGALTASGSCGGDL